MAKDNKKLVQAITSQEENFAQWYTDICVKAELVEYSSVKGFIILRPYGQAIWELIQKDMDARFKATGHENVAMPVLIPFTYSWGSGAHRSLVGYFDSATKETVLPDFIYWGNDMVLNTDSNGVLGIYHADCDIESFVDIEMEAKDRLASIVWESQEISVVEETE